MTTATKDQVSERVVAALVEFGEEPENVKPDSRFEDLDIDSLDLVELAQVIEDEYKIEVTDADMDKIATVQDVVDFVAERQQSCPAGPPSPGWGRSPPSGWAPSRCTSAGPRGIPESRTASDAARSSSRPITSPAARC